MMLLSELYGKIGQALRENGDMRVVRPVRKEFEPICSVGPMFKELPSEAFICEVTDFYTEKGVKYDTRKQYIVNVV